MPTYIYYQLVVGWAMPTLHLLPRENKQLIKNQFGLAAA
jgi:hypothetical protein